MANMETWTDIQTFTVPCTYNYTSDNKTFSYFLGKPRNEMWGTLHTNATVTGMTVLAYFVVMTLLVVVLHTALVGIVVRRVILKKIRARRNSYNSETDGPPMSTRTFSLLQQLQQCNLEKLIVEICDQHLLIGGAYVTSFMLTPDIGAVTSFEWNVGLNLLLMIGFLQVMALSSGWVYLTPLHLGLIRSVAFYVIVGIAYLAITGAHVDPTMPALIPANEYTDSLVLAPVGCQMNQTFEMLEMMSNPDMYPKGPRIVVPVQFLPVLLVWFTVLLVLKIACPLVFSRIRNRVWWRRWIIWGVGVVSLVLGVLAEMIAPMTVLFILQIKRWTVTSGWVSDSVDDPAQFSQIMAIGGFIMVSLALLEFFHKLLSRRYNHETLVHRWSTEVHAGVLRGEEEKGQPVHLTSDGSPSGPDSHSPRRFGGIFSGSFLAPSLHRREREYEGQGHTADAVSEIEPASNDRDTRSVSTISNDDSRSYRTVDTGIRVESIDGGAMLRESMTLGAVAERMNSNANASSLTV